jgi:DNA-binding GntR family transcriptional regulator
MGSFDNYAHRAISKAQAATARKAKQAKKEKLASGAPVATNLSLQYDNDGNPVEHEPKGYTSNGGH